MMRRWLNEEGKGRGREKERDEGVGRPAPQIPSAELSVSQARDTRANGTKERKREEERDRTVVVGLPPLFRIRSLDATPPPAPSSTHSGEIVISLFCVSEQCRAECRTGYAQESGQTAGYRPVLLRYHPPLLLSFFCCLVYPRSPAGATLRTTEEEVIRRRENANGANRVSAEKEGRQRGGRPRANTIDQPSVSTLYYIRFALLSALYLL